MPAGPRPAPPARSQPPIPDDLTDGLEIIEPLCAVFRRKLKAEGLKYTPERAQILDSVIRFDGVFEVEKLIELLRKGPLRVSKATIYRTVRLLQEAGIIQRVLFDQEQSHYQLVYGRKPSDLVVRMDTREIIPIDVPELVALRDKLCGQLGLDPMGHRFQIFAVGHGAAKSATL
ncbi:MAG: transcriptional repressor [Phycisphaerales bacterium]|nr:transcriptional repressor [Phycisphaerales bacterium]